MVRGRVASTIVAIGSPLPVARATEKIWPWRMLPLRTILGAVGSETDNLEIPKIKAFTREWRQTSRIGAGQIIIKAIKTPPSAKSLTRPQFTNCRFWRARFSRIRRQRPRAYHMRCCRGRSGVRSLLSLIPSILVSELIWHPFRRMRLIRI